MVVVVASRADFGGVGGRYKQEQNKVGQRQSWSGEDEAGRWDGRRGSPGCVTACPGNWEKPRRLNHLGVAETERSAVPYG